MVACNDRNGAWFARRILPKPVVRIRGSGTLLVPIQTVKRQRDGPEDLPRRTSEGRTSSSSSFRRALSDVMQRTVPKTGRSGHGRLYWPSTHP